MVVINAPDAKRGKKDDTAPRQQQVRNCPRLWFAHKKREEIA
jgi:hypothetical protein